MPRQANVLLGLSGTKMVVLFKTAIANAFTNVWLPMVAGGVAVINGANTAQGIRDPNTLISMGMGVEESRDGLVVVLADSIGVVDVDGEISVGGKRVWVSSVDSDAANATVAISYSESQPVPESLA